MQVGGEKTACLCASTTLGRMWPEWHLWPSSAGILFPSPKLGVDIDEGSPDKEGQRGVDFLSKLPPEISIYILSLLPCVLDVLHSSLVCHEWHRLASEPVLWRQLFLQQRGWSSIHKQIEHVLPRVLPSTYRSVSDWQKIYMSHFELERRWTLLQTKLRGDTVPTPFRPHLSRLQGHRDSIYTCCFVPCQGPSHRGYIVTGSRDRAIRVWDSETAECVSEFSAHHGSVLSLYYQDGVLVSGSSDGTACVFYSRPPTKTTKPHFSLLRTLQGHGAGVLGVGGDHQWIVTASRDTTLRVWHSDTGALARTYTGHHSCVNACYVNEGNVASAAADGSVHIWDPSTGHTLQILPAVSSGVATVLLHQDLCFTGSNDKMVRIWRWRSKECICEFQAHQLLVRTLAYDPYRCILVTGGWDRMSRIWHLAPILHDMPSLYGQGRPQLLFENGLHHGRIFHVAVDATRVLAACEDKSVWVADYIGHDLNAPDLYYY